ncbi:MAG: 1-deoxy-D-xylulose-5-phosphate reductoisomerase [Candidatus Omnitrophica bacterium]|nr:1-deoxy-D-xylulose-5-phosphate reductoisomerase [Candidatus Omnitrophota bacterium]
MIRVAVLGSTGSIGTSTLDVIASQPERLSLVGIAARSNIGVLAQQIARHRPRLVAVFEAEQAAALRRQVNGAVLVRAGVEGLRELATHPDVDIVVVGTSGREALVPLIRAIESGKRIALASKELLVMAGELIMRLVREHGTSLIPVDSEHAALFQALQGVPREEVARLIVTGSGGPLWGLDRAAMAHVTRQQVLHHPKWQMGPKITVDSATLMNKGLELIEAQWLFGMTLSRLGVIIHPQALIHALVELVDGSCLAQLSVCDMRLPIQYALSYPQRWPTPLPGVRWQDLSGAQFFEPDPERFPCLRLALEAARAGGTACAALSAANDAAVWAYLRDELAFLDIPHVIAETLQQHAPSAHPTLDDILKTDDWARQTAQELIRARQRVSVPAA